MKCHGESMEGKTVVVSGAGNVAIYAIQKAQQMGAKLLPVLILPDGFMIRKESMLHY